MLQKEIKSMSNEYLRKIRTLMADKVGVEPSEVTAEAHFEADLNIGDLELVDILTDLEDEYDVELISQKDELETVEDLLNLLSDKLD